jgi:hypothetical protein
MCLRARGKTQSQSHLHSHQVNAESSGNSTRGIPASRASSQHVYKEDIRVPYVLPHITGASRLPHWLCCKPATKTSTKRRKEYPTCSLTQRALRGYRTGWCSAALLGANNCRRGVRVTTTANSGVSARVSRTSDIPQF